MEQYTVKLIQSEFITHNVKKFTIEKPNDYRYEPGQATDVIVNNPEWLTEKRPFTFTSLNHWKNLEFTIKIYPEHNGVTQQLEKLQPGDEIIIHDAWGAITYKGKGVFIAGGAGITPFIAILRQLYEDKKMEDHKLIFSNKTSDDIILRDELDTMMGKDYYDFLTREKVIGFIPRHIDEDYLKEIIRDFGQFFYVCGPEKFVEDINAILLNLGANSESLVFET